MRNGNSCPTPGIHIRFGKNNCIGPDCFIKFSSPYNGIIAGDRFVNVNDKIRFHDTFDLFKLAHQIGFGMESSCCVSQNYIDFVGNCKLDCVKKDRGGIRSFLVLDNFYTDSSGVYTDLLNCAGPVSISRTNNNRISQFF